MAFTTPQYGQAGSYTAAQDRTLNAAFARTAGVRRLIPAAAGVMQGDLAVSSSGSANATVNIGLGDCFIDDGTGALYFSTNATTVATATFTANSSGTTRTDLVYVQITDTGLASPTIAVAVAAGSVTVPAKAIGLATVAIPNGFTVSTQVQNAWITDVRKKAQIADFSVTGTAAVASPISGNVVFDTSTSPSGKLKVYNTAGAWEPVVSGASLTNDNMATGYTMLVQSASAPSPATDGQLWFDTANKRLMEYRSSDTTWQRIAQTIAAGRTGITLTRAANQTITNGAPANVSWTAKSFDSDSFAGTLPVTSITIPAGLGGIYALAFRWTWQTDPGSSAIVWIRITSGTTNYLFPANYNAYGYSLAPALPTGVSVTIPLAAGDVIQTPVYHNLSPTPSSVNGQGIFDCYRVGI